MIYFCWSFLAHSIPHSLITLAVQNALLTIIMHYSRVSIPQSQAYSAASAVLLNELLKGTISLCIAFFRLEDQELKYPHSPHPQKHPMVQAKQGTRSFISRCRRLGKEIFSPDCWKLSIPAILYGAYQQLAEIRSLH